MGLLNAVVPREQLLDKAREYAQRIIANAPLAVQATKQSALQGLYFDEDLTKQLRAAVRELRAAVADGADPARRGRDPRAARQGAALAVREGVEALEPHLPDRGRQGRPEGVRREAPAGVARRGERGRPADAVHHRRRRAHVASRRRRASGRARAARHVGARRARRGAPTRPAPTCSTSSTASRSSTARRGSTTTRSRASPNGSGPIPKHRHYSGIGGTTTQQLVNATAERMLARRARPRADHERRGARDATRLQEARRALPVLVQARREAPVPVGVAARPGRGRARGVPGVAHVRGVRQRAARPPRDAGSTSTATAIGRMLAPMTRDRGRRTRTRGSRSRARADEIVTPGARQPHGRLPVHEVHGRGDGRRHGRRARRRDARARRRARRARRPARVPPRLVLRDRSGARRRASRHVAVARDGGRERRDPRGVPAPASTTSRTSTCTRASRARCTSRATPSASHRPIRVASPSPAACRTTADRRADTSPTRSRRWSSGCAPTPARSGSSRASACT